jgi:hypothetical protein
MVFGIFWSGILKNIVYNLVYLCTFCLAHFLKILILMSLIKSWDIVHMGIINVFSFS